MEDMEYTTLNKRVRDLQGGTVVTTLPAFKLGVEELTDRDPNQRRLVTKTIRISEELHNRIVDAIHHPGLPFGGHFSAFGNWALEKAVEAAAEASNDPEFRSLAMAHRRLKELHDRHQHSVTFDEEVTKSLVEVDLWLRSGDLDAALATLLNLNETLPDCVRAGRWRRFLASRILSGGPTQDTLRRANAGTPEQMRRAQSISAFLEAATGE